MLVYVVRSYFFIIHDCCIGGFTSGSIIYIIVFVNERRSLRGILHSSHTVRRFNAVNARSRRNARNIFCLEARRSSVKAPSSCFVLCGFSFMGTAGQDYPSWLCLIESKMPHIGQRMPPFEARDVFISLQTMPDSAGSSSSTDSAPTSNQSDAMFFAPQANGPSVAAMSGPEVPKEGVRPSLKRAAEDWESQLKRAKGLAPLDASGERVTRYDALDRLPNGRWDGGAFIAQPRPFPLPSDNGSDVIRALLASRERANRGNVANTSFVTPSIGLRSEQALLNEITTQQYLQQQVRRSNAAASAAQLISTLSSTPSLSHHHHMNGNHNPVNLSSLQHLQANTMGPFPDPFVTMSEANMLGQLRNLSQYGMNQSPVPYGRAGALALADVSGLPEFLQRLHHPQPSLSSVQSNRSGMNTSTSRSSSVGSLSHRQTTELLPCEEGPLQDYSLRVSSPLGIAEDPNWLSEFHCFVRSDLIEVFRASREDCKLRNYSISHKQVGIRCRFCAHLPGSSRAGRSSAFPSSLSQIYQSFTMMLRDHFSNCGAMPLATQTKFLALKDKPSQGATDSKRYWVYSGTKIGMADSPDGIIVNEATLALGSNAPPFGSVPGQPWADDTWKNAQLVHVSDRMLVSEFLVLLLSQAQLVRLTESERIGNRRSLAVGLPGLGCRYCCEHRRLGLCRVFPARRRTLPVKVNDLFDHLRRCTVCPNGVKEQLEQLHHVHMNDQRLPSVQGGDREFFDRIWTRLGHGPQSD